MPEATTNRLTAMALSLAFHHAGVHDAAGALAQAARGNRTALELALARVRRGLMARPSPVGDRAAAMLAGALVVPGAAAAPPAPLAGATG